MRILFLAPYPRGEAPSQRFRFEQYLELLKEKEVDYSFQSFLDIKTWDKLYKKGFFFHKIAGILKGFLRRGKILFSVNQYDRIFIHRELTPIGPPILEWILIKVIKKKVVFDFDDAIWLENTSDENKLIAALKWHSKTNSLCKWSHVISAGNKYLTRYAENFNSNVRLNPTTIDTFNLHIPGNVKNDVPIVGWTGTHSTGKYLNEIVDVLKDVSKAHQFRFRYISNKKPDFSLPNLEFIRWSGQTEIEDLDQIDIGLMPLKDDEWAKGKCGFKALQYMSLEKTTLASPVGVNKDIIQDGVNGFLCKNLEDWKSKLIEALEDEHLRQRIGEKARKTVIKRYSLKSNIDNFINILTS